MRKWIVTLLCFLLGGNLLFAQQRLEIKGSGTDLYLEHKVAPRETLFSIGRSFHIAPKIIAAYNKIPSTAGLNVGQALRIPLQKENFTQEESPAAASQLVPVYHTVSPSETLYRLGVNYNKVPLSSLRKWNKLSGDALNVGEAMIVGYLIVDKNSELANNASSQPPVAPATVTANNSEAKQAEIIYSRDESAEKPAVASTETAASTAETSNGNTTRRTVSQPGSGYFKALYEQQVSGKTPVKSAAIASVFKSTSGWQDSKYYCFIDKATPGAVVEITDIVSGKSIYAKVLDAIPEIKQNDGVDIIISNAAAEALGAIENKFNCRIAYVSQ